MNVLLAEDDEEDVMIFQLVLSEIDKEVRLLNVKNGVKCMEQLRQAEFAPDIIFLDINMPLKNGLQCLEEIRREESLRHVKVVMLSTSDNVDIIKVAKEKGADEYISKSQTFSKLRSSIALVLNAAEKI